jgi:NAD+ synthase (glutamine-hydrolysing)
MKIALVQLNFHVGNLTSNAEKIKNSIAQAKLACADLVVFSELSVCGYPPKDLLLHERFIKACEKTIVDIAKSCKGIAAIVGGPSRNKELKGKPLYNSAFLLKDGKVLEEVHKSLIPNYDVFDEYRYFEPSASNKLITYKGFKIALTICEDIWNQIPDKNGRWLYKQSPIENFAKLKPDCIINISASPFSYTHANERKKVCENVTKKCKAPLFYLNTLGANTDLIFDGGSMVMDGHSFIINEMEYFTEGMSLYELSAKKKVEFLSGKKHNVKHDPARFIHDALVLGLRDYFGKNNLKGAILGLSGGIDSAVVLALAVEALGKENVHAVMMPSQYTSEQSLADAASIVKNIGCSYESISIQQGIKALTESLAPSFRSKPADVTEENLQARLRSVLLMALSNKMGYLLLNTSNKSELATGYGTLYGDMSGALSVIGDLYKTMVYKLAHYINSIKPGLIPENIITRPPSAELKPNQKDTDSLPEYGILDAILYYYIEEEKSANDIKVKAADKALIDKIVSMVNRNEYKRQQFAPILRISPKAFGTGRRMPIVAKYL